MQIITKPPKKNSLPIVLKYQQRKKWRFPYRIFLLVGLCFSLTALQEAWAGSYTSNLATNVTSGSWNTSTNWSPQGVPGPGDDVIIQAGHQITLGGNVSCASVTIQNSVGSSESTLSLGSYTLTLGSITLTPGSSNGNNAEKVKLDFGTGTLKVINAIISQATSSTKNNLTLTYTQNSIIEFSGTQHQTLVLDANGLKYPNIHINNPAGVTLNSSITKQVVEGDIIIKNGELNNAGFAIGGNNTTIFEIQQNGTLVLTGTSSFPTGFSNVNLNPGSTVEYAGTSQTIAIQPYSNLKISGSGIKNLGSPITLDQAMEISSGNTLNLSGSNGSITLGDYDLTIKQGASITGYNASRYIKQDGNGKLIIEGITGGSATEVTFPVGTDNSYTPAYIKNVGDAGGSGSYAVRVNTGVNNNSGQAVTSLVAKRTWDVSRITGTGSPNITLRLQWDPATDEGDGFERTNVGIAHFSEGAWLQPPTNTFLDGSTSYSATLQNITSFSPFAVVNPNNPLPVELISFKATPKETGVNLQWTTASEKNNQGFQVQHSANGLQFEDIAFVASKNPNASTLQQYEFLDKTTAHNGLRYYRLKQTDFDGTVAYSAIKVVEFEKHFPSVYPNPFQKTFSLNLQASGAEELRYHITDLTGKTVYQNAQKLNKGNNTLRIQLPENNPAGFYLLHTQTSGRTTSTRLIKQ